MAVLIAKSQGQRLLELNKPNYGKCTCLHPCRQREAHITYALPVANGEPSHVTSTAIHRHS